MISFVSFSLIKSVIVRSNVNTDDWKDLVIIKRIDLPFNIKTTKENPKITFRQQAGYRERINNLQNQLSVTSQKIQQKEQELIEVKSRIESLKQSHLLAKEEYAMTKPLGDEGVVPQIDILKLQRLSLFISQFLRFRMEY